MGKKAFVDSVSWALKAHGFAQANEPGDLVIDVPDSFSLKPWQWAWDGASWAPYALPLTQDQIDTNAARTDSAINILKAMQPAQARTWVNANVNSLADAKQLLGTMAAVLCVIARRI